MRQPQHRNRARARSRRQPNPVTRVYESSGPDVKVRGTPQQIAEKYMQLGRDALSAGDDVKAENYFQHAEHYLRIIATALEQQQARRQQQQQKRQEALARRRGGNEQATVAGVEKVTTDTAAIPTEPLPKDVDGSAEAAAVDEPTEPKATRHEQAKKGNGGDWGDVPPQFLTVSVTAAPGADDPDAGANAGGESAPAATSPVPEQAQEAMNGSAAADASATGATPTRKPRGASTRRRANAARRKGNGADMNAATAAKMPSETDAIARQQAAQAGEESAAPTSPGADPGDDTAEETGHNG